jgi:hypothetical protein
LVAVSGPVTVHVHFEGAVEGDALDDDGNGRDDVQTELVALNLSGLSPTLGPVVVRLHPGIPSLGGLEETANNTPGVLDVPPFTAAGSADSFFDIFFEIEVGGQLFYTLDPKQMRSRITHKPPGPGETFDSQEPVTLYDANGDPTDFTLGVTSYTPNPEPPTLEITLLPDGVVQICWPDDGRDFVLQSTRSLAPPIAWEAATEPVVTVDGKNCVSVDASLSMTLYRLCSECLP